MATSKEQHSSRPNAHTVGGTPAERAPRAARSGEAIARENEAGEPTAPGERRDPGPSVPADHDGRASDEP